MQDNYIGDIGDYGKYALLRQVDNAKLLLSVNWYRVIPSVSSTQNDGKHISYLNAPHLYRAYDPPLFDALHKIVCIENSRRIERIEAEALFHATYFSEKISSDRTTWHMRALEKTKGTAVVFLDPDNGLETQSMNRTGSATEKHVRWNELKEYYDRGQNVILYQHRPQMTKKEQCIGSIMAFQKEYLRADAVKLLEFPKYTNRFYFMFLHNDFKGIFQDICASTVHQLCRNDFCHEIVLE
ncbi:MAG: hypothetical protein ACI4WV_05315 [Eubacteriales bacterium]